MKTKPIYLGPMIDNILGQLLVILSITSLFYFSALISPVTYKMTSSGLIFCISIFTVTALTAILKVYFNRYSIKEPAITTHNTTKGLLTFFQTFYRFLVKEKFAFLLIMIVIALRLPMLWTLKIGDSGLYNWEIYTACRNFDFSPGSIVSNFRFFAHSSFGYGGLLGIGQFLFPQKVYAIPIINLILSAFGSLFLFRLFKDGFWRKFDALHSAIAALFCFSLPLFYGLSGYVFLDYGVAIFLVFIIYMESRNKYILFWFWSIILCQSKETGALFFAAYIIFRAAHQLIIKNGTFTVKLKKLFFDPINIATVLSGITYLTYTIGTKGFLEWNSIASSQNVPAVFGIDVRYIIKQIAQLLLLNFNWLLIILIVSFSIFIIYHNVRKIHKLFINLQNISGIIGIMFAQFVFTCLFVTFPLPKYNIVWTLFLGILTSAVGLYVWDEFAKHNKRITAFSLGIVLLMIIQTFYSIDPIPNMIFHPVVTGNKLVPQISINVGPNFKNGWNGDYSTYNYQYTWIGRTLSKVLKNSGYSTNMDILIFGFNQFIVQLNNNLTTWDTNNNCLSVEQGKNTIGLSLKYQNDIEDGNHLRPLAIVYFLPFPENLSQSNNMNLAFLTKYYDIGPRSVMKDYAGQIDYYLLKLKEK